MSIDGAFNLRDLGGTPVEGGVVADRSMIRSDLLHRRDAAAARDWLAAQQIATVVDLRTAGEREEAGFLESDERVTTLHRPLLDEVWSWEDEHAATDEWFLRDRTIEMFERHPDRILEVVQLFAHREGGLVVHCTAGKDRTGVVTAAVLGVLGAPTEVIVADYAASKEGLRRLIEFYIDRRDPADRDDGRAEVLLERGASPATMAGVIEVLVDRHGSIREWAFEHGFTHEDLAALRSRRVRAE